MDKIILVGGGGHCRSCIDVIEKQGKFEIAGVVEKTLSSNASISGYPIIGFDEDLPGIANDFQQALITVGFTKTAEQRKKIYHQLITLGFRLPVVVSPRAYVAKDVTIGQGTVIMHDALLNAGSKVGNNCIINTKALIEHDSIIGNNCHISTGAIINGSVNVGRDSFVGSHATVIHNTEVPQQTFIKAAQIFKRSKNV